MTRRDVTYHERDDYHNRFCNELVKGDYDVAGGVVVIMDKRISYNEEGV
jgi:hypothetical protein